MSRDVWKAAKNCMAINQQEIKYIQIAHSYQKMIVPASCFLETFLLCYPNGQLSLLWISSVTNHSKGYVEEPIGQPEKMRPRMLRHLLKRWRLCPACSWSRWMPSAVWAFTTTEAVQESPAAQADFLKSALPLENYPLCSSELILPENKVLAKSWLTRCQFYEISWQFYKQMDLGTLEI